MDYTQGVLEAWRHPVTPVTSRVISWEPHNGVHQPIMVRLTPTKIYGLPVTFTLHNVIVLPNIHMVCDKVVTSEDEIFTTRLISSLEVHMDCYNVHGGCDCGVTRVMVIMKFISVINKCSQVSITAVTIP